MFLLFLFMETIADEQQYRFQTYKHSLTGEARRKHPNPDIRAVTEFKTFASHTLTFPFFNRISFVFRDFIVADYFDIAGTLTILRNR